MSERARTVALLMLAVVVGQAFARFTFALLLPAVKADLLDGYGIAGFVGTINVGAYLAGTAAVSVASLRVRLDRIVKCGLLLCTSGLALLASAPNVGVLVLGMIVCGVGGAAVYVPSPGIAAAAFPPDQRGRAVGLVGVGIGGGIVLATQLTNGVRALSDGGQWRPIWFIEAGLGVCISVVVIAMLRPGAQPPPAAPPRLAALRHVPAWWAITGVYFCYGLAYILLISFIVAALEADAGFGRGHAALSYAVIGASTIPGGIVGGRLADRWGRRRTLMGGYLLAAGCVLLPLTHAEPWVTFGLIGYGLAFSANVAAIAGYVSDHAPAQEFTAAFGALTMAFGVGQTIGPQVGGWLADRTGSFSATFMVSSAVWLLGAGFATRLAARSRV